MSDKQTIGELVYKISGDMDGLKTELKKSETAVQDIGKKLEDTDKKTKSFGDSLKNLAKFAGLAYLAKLAVDFGKASLQAYANAQQSAIQFNNAQQNVAGTTKEQINSMNDYVKALEDKTSVDDKTIRQGAQILAQDQIKIENQKKLLGGIVDLAVANAKANGGEIDVAGTAKAVGRVVATGDAGILTRQNVVIDPKTAKALAETGDQAKRTALLMQVLDENAKGAGEALGNSFQGKINKAKDVMEDLQVAVGKGLSVALSVLGGELADTVADFGITADGGNKFGVAMTFVAGVLGFVINTIKLLGLGLVSAGNILYQTGKITFAFGKDVIGVFKQVGSAITSIGTAMKKVLSGDFGEAVDAIKNGFDFSDTFENSSKAVDGLLASNEKLANQMLSTTKNMGDNIKTMADAKTVYEETAKAQDALTEAKDASNKVQAQETALTQSQEDALKKLSEASDNYKQKFLDVIQSIKENVASLNDDLKKSFKKFNDDFKSSISDSGNLVDIFVDAEEKIKSLKKEIGKADAGTDTSDLRDQLAEQQRIIQSRADYEKRQADTIAEIKKKLTDAGIDADKEGLTALTNVTALKDQIKREEELRALDAFAREEALQKEKLLLLTDTLIAEVTAIREKITQQEALELELSTFLKTQLNLRKADVDAFASNAIAKYGQMANALRSAISLQQQLQNMQGGTAKKQFASGGFVGSDGGEVHPGEFVIPANMVRGFPGLVSQLEDVRRGGGNTNNSTINAPINVQANGMGDRLDASAVAKEIAWELGKL